MIVLQNDRLTGLTTASGLWVSAGIGIACGYGMYSLAIIATILVLIIFTFFYFLEQKIRGYEDRHGEHGEE
jgi:putative Mg2+ transporter-C (MgtC) family protein